MLLGPAVGTSRVSLELPCLSEPVVQAMLGPQLLRKASNGKNQLQVRFSQRSDSVLCTYQSIAVQQGVPASRPVHTPAAGSAHNKK